MSSKYNILLKNNQNVTQNPTEDHQKLTQINANTNNKMAAPAPVQLQRPVTVSDLVCCVFVYVHQLANDHWDPCVLHCTFSE